MGRLFAGLCALLLAVPLLAGAAAAGILGGGSGGGTSQPPPSPAAEQQIPADYQRLYAAAAATCPGLSWSVLAAVGKVETDHGQNPDWTSDAGGPMQFEPATFAAYGVDGDADGTADINNPADAIYSAAHYLCASGARDGANIPAALYTYNKDNSYVARVLTQADVYTSADISVTTGPSEAALTAVDYATAQLGLPYLWGGDGPQLTELPDGRVKVTGGFDCSGLTRAAYAAAGVNLPRTAQQQYEAGPLVPASSVLQPGDLLFFGTGPGDVTHVGIAISSTQMINAPHRGAVVRIDSIWRNLVGVTRPADRG